jgi:hypothetical protein
VDVIMIRVVTPAALVLICAAAASAQEPAARQPAKKKPPTLTLSGCVQRSETSAGQFTLQQGDDIYRLTGMDVRDYIGRRVQVVGGAPSRLKIVGGLLPSANVAAQAGAMDPARAATAAADASARSGTGPEPEFRVRSIKPLSGSCP